MKQIKHGSVCIHFLDFLLRFANEKGLDAKALILMARLDPHVFEDQDSRMPAVTFMKVWNHIADYCEDPHFGLHLGSHLTHFPFSHIVFSVMLNDRNLLSALKNMIRYHNLMSDLISPRLFVDDKTVVFSIEKQDDDIPEKRQYSEFIFAMVLTFLRYLNAGKTDPQIVRFSHGKPDDFSEQTNFFKSKIVFGDKKDE
ncbi:MAG: AraC family transcriptional regulator, partial [Proteobacteria bacterium]|nr:AraC family transcriptional regulator [Pseudomonadota bacterium]